MHAGFAICGICAIFAICDVFAICSVFAICGVFTIYGVFAVCGVYTWGPGGRPGGHRRHSRHCDQQTHGCQQGGQDLFTQFFIFPYLISFLMIFGYRSGRRLLVLRGG